MTGQNYKPKPPRVQKSTLRISGDEVRQIEQIVIDLNWWESCLNPERPSISQTDRDYLNGIVVGSAICPRMVFLKNEERARKILGLEA